MICRITVCSKTKFSKKINKTDFTSDGLQQIILLIQAKHQRLLIVLSEETGDPPLSKLQATSIPRYSLSKNTSV